MMDTPQIDHITILACDEIGKSACKTFRKRKDGSIEKIDFSAGTKFRWRQEQVSSIHDVRNVLSSLLDRQNEFVIRGEPIDFNKKEVFRRATSKENNCFIEKSRKWVVIDIDKLLFPDFMDIENAPEQVLKYVIQLLPEPFRNASFVAKFSSSQNVASKAGEKPKKQISVHLIFWFDRPISCKELKSYFRQESCKIIDTSLYNPVQPHYTAKPIFEGINDPLNEKRIIFIQGEHDIVTLPEIKEPEIIRKENNIITIDTLNDKNSLVKLLASKYPSKDRQKYCSAVSGSLCRFGLELEYTIDIISTIASLANDEELYKRELIPHSIYDAVENGRPAQGIPTLIEDFNFTDEEIENLKKYIIDEKAILDRLLPQLSNKSESSEIEKAIRLALNLPIVEQEKCIEEIGKATNTPTKILNKIRKKVSRPQFEENEDLGMKAIEESLKKNFNNGQTILKSLDKCFWTYKGNKWVILQDEEIRKLMIPICNELVKKSGGTVSTLLNSAMNIFDSYIYQEEDLLNFKSEPKQVFNFLNCSVWINEKFELEIKPHKYSDYLRYSVNANYSPKAECPKFKRAVLEMFSKSSNPKEMYRHLLEVIAYICMPYRGIASIFLFYGNGNDGKGTIISIIRKIIGDEQIFSDKIQNFDKSVFGTGALLGKLLYLDDDVSKGIYLDDGLIKKISEEKLLSGQKKYKDFFELTSRVVPVMLANNHPRVKDLSNGFKRRAHVIPFNRQFTEDEAKRGLFDKIWQEESSGILNEVITSYINLRKRGKFLMPQDCLDATNEWIDNTNSLAYYIKEFCDKGSDKKQKFSEFYSNLSNHMDVEKDGKPAQKRNVLSDLKALNHRITTSGNATTIHGLYMPSRWEWLQNNKIKGEKVKIWDV